MKLCVSKEWMRQKIEGDLDYNVEAGRVIRNSSDVVMAMKSAAQESKVIATPSAEPVATVTPTGQALGRLVQMIRRKDKLTVAQFAEKLRIAPAEIEAIEKDPTYAPRPRTVHNFAEYVKVPARTILGLMPNAPKPDVMLNEAAYRFAASSNELSDLSKKERESLRDFVKFLSNHKEVGSNND